jgi:hypothetical protein
MAMPADDGLYVQSTIRNGDDSWGRLISRLGLFTNTASQASTGGPNSHTHWAGIQGMGVHRAMQLTQPLQAFVSLVRPVARPIRSERGMQAGSIGVQGFPSTGRSADPFLIAMSSQALGNTAVTYGYGD